MSGKSKVYFRNLMSDVTRLVARRQSAIIFGPRQTGKTTLIRQALHGIGGVMDYPLQHPQVRLELERDPAALVRQVEAQSGHSIVFIDEAQKVPALFDSVQYLIDGKKASFIITGSSARKLKRKGTNLLPGRVKTFRLDPLQWNEFGWSEHGGTILSPVEGGDAIKGYSFEQSLIFGSLPGMVAIGDDSERKEMLTAYTHIYLEEEIRAEALSRKVGAFGRFLELAARESGECPNQSNLSVESGVSAPTIKEFYSILEDTLVVERVDPFMRNARKRILATPRYYFFDIGVRNALARVPLNRELLHTDKGKLFEHAVILEIIRRIRSLKLDYRVHFWRTQGGAEVDCVIDKGDTVIPIEVKSSARVSLADLRGLRSFLESYPKLATKAFVVTQGRVPEKLSDNITAIPWGYL